MTELLTKEKQKQRLLRKLGYDIPRSQDFILSKSRLKPGPILEIGTGKGHFTVALAKRGFWVASIDLDPKPQKMAREYLRQKRLSKNVRILIMNAENLDFPDDSFENIISVNFMHHAQRPIRCLSEIVRVARSKIVIADINKKGEDILDRVHKREGRRHPRSRISFLDMRAFLQKKGLVVRTYKGFCQTIFVAQKGAKNENMHSNRNK